MLRLHARRAGTVGRALRPHIWAATTPIGA